MSRRLRTFGYLTGLYLARQRSGLWFHYCRPGPEHPARRFLVAAIVVAAASSAKVVAGHQRVIAQARLLLEQAQVSYIYGGADVGDAASCERCIECQARHLPAAGGPSTQILASCPSCATCSLDCSHFVQLTHRRAGLALPYLTSTMMRTWSTDALARVGLGVVAHISGARPGDILVYDGHVVLLERRQASRGDILHATVGRAIRGPGQGIQRARNVPLTYFHGPLRRILRWQGPARTKSNARQTLRRPRPGG